MDSLRWAKGVGLKKPASNPHQIILTRVESASWRPFTKTRLTSELVRSKDIEMRLTAWAGHSHSGEQQEVEQQGALDQKRRHVGGVDSATCFSQIRDTHLVKMLN